MSFSLQNGRGRSSTVAPKTLEPVGHNCANGHVWMAAMHPVAGQERWRYLNKQDCTCPQCGGAQTEEEPL